jgi:hypothetical protein
LVEKFVREKLWNRVKFILADEELHYNGKQLYLLLLAFKAYLPKNMFHKKIHAASTR